MAARNPWLRPAGTDGYVPVVVLRQRLAALYGVTWRDQFADESAVVAWQEEAAALLYARGVSFAMVKQALEALRARLKPGDLPPGVVELVELAMPSLDAEGTFAEAKHAAVMCEGNRRAWSHAAVYWAAVDFGWRRLSAAQWRGRDKADWTRMLARRLSGQCPAVPVAPEPVTYQKGDPAVARAALATMRAQLVGGR
ncbi:hypothetical protein ACTSKR_11370 [Chitinibacteraceae bacterium HSL-7]